MAINTQKLLPVSKPTTAERMAASYDRRVDSVFNVKVKTTLIDVDKLLKKNLKEDKKVAKKTKSVKKREKRQKREEKLEAPKGLGIASGALSKAKSLMPRTGLLDAIQRFATFTFLGYLFTQFQKISNLFNIQKENEKGEKTTENIFVSIVNSLDSFVGNTFTGTVNAIQGAYDAYDKVRAEIEKNAGPEAVKNFDKFSDALKGVITAAVTLGGAWIASGGLGRARSYKKGFRDGVIAGRRGRKPPTGGSSGNYAAGYSAGFAAGLAAGRGGRPGAGFRDPGRYRSPGQARAGGSFESNLSRQQLTTERMLRPSGPRGPLGRINSSLRGVGAQLETGTLFKGGKGLQKFLFKVLRTRAGLKAVGKFFGPILKRIPIIGGLIDFALNYFVFKEPIQKAAFSAIGATIFGALGATAGSIIPIGGTFVGGVLGGLAGDLAGRWLYDTFFANKSPVNAPQDPIEGRAAGGQVGGGLLIPKSLRPRSMRGNDVIPGKDISPLTPIDQLYPNPVDKRIPNALETLVRISDTFDRGGWISKLMAVGVKVALGHLSNPNKIAKSISGGIEKLMNAQLGGLDIVSKATLGLANGGLIPDIASSNRMLLSLLAESINSSMRDSLKLVSDELNKPIYARIGDPREDWANEQQQEREKAIAENKRRAARNEERGLKPEDKGYEYPVDVPGAPRIVPPGSGADVLNKTIQREADRWNENIIEPIQKRLNDPFWQPPNAPKVGEEVGYLNTYPSYDTASSTTYIQPVIITKMLPIPTGSSGGVIAFPVPVGVNNTMASLSRA